MGLTQCLYDSGLLYGNVGSHLASDTEEVSALSGNRHDLPGASKSAEDPGELEYFFHPGGHLGHRPVAWAEASWPVAGPGSRQVRQQVPLTLEGVGVSCIQTLRDHILSIDLNWKFTAQ